MDEVKVLLGGMAAEEICNGYISPGCGGDINQAISILTTLVGREGCYGLENIDNYNLRSGEQQAEYNRKVREVLDQTYQEVKRVLGQYSGMITVLSKDLSQRGYLTGIQFHENID